MWRALQARVAVCLSTLPEHYPRKTTPPPPQLAHHHEPTPTIRLISRPHVVPLTFATGANDRRSRVALRAIEAPVEAPASSIAAASPATVPSRPPSECCLVVYMICSCGSSRGALSLESHRSSSEQRRAAAEAETEPMINPSMAAPSTNTHKAPASSCMASTTWP